MAEGKPVPHKQAVPYYTPCVKCGKADHRRFDGVHNWNLRCKGCRRCWHRYCHDPAVDETVWATFPLLEDGARNPVKWKCVQCSAVKVQPQATASIESNVIDLTLDDDVDVKPAKKAPKDGLSSKGNTVIVDPRHPFANADLGIPLRYNSRETEHIDMNAAKQDIPQLAKYIARMEDMQRSMESMEIDPKPTSSRRKGHASKRECPAEPTFLFLAEEFGQIAANTKLPGW